jgi:hypothetical protein
MPMLTYLALVISLIGAFIWFAVADTKPKLQQLGHDMFVCGLLAFLITAIPILAALTVHTR